MYFYIKIIHVMSAAILFGTGLGTAFYMFLVNQQKNIALIARATKQVVFVDYVFTGTSGVIQFITGMAMLGLKNISFSSLWVMVSIAGYLIAGACWFPVVYLQIRCRDLALDALKNNTTLSQQYYRYYRIWRILGIPAFLALLVVFYFMVNKPV